MSRRSQARRQSLLTPLARRTAVAAAAVMAMVATAAIGAVPATAVPVADVPPNAADWATTPYSPLPPAAIAVDNDLELSFDGVDGGLHTGADVGTGFTMVQPSSADPTYYLPENLDVADSRLTVTATKGIAFAKPGGTTTGLVNQQENTLGVGVDPTDTNLRFTTTLTSPATANSSAQAGLWFGPDDDNYVKLAVVASTATGRQIQLAREIGGVMATGSATAPTADQVMVDTTQAALGSQPITLTLDVNTLMGTMTGRYRVGDGADQVVGTLELPATFHDGSLLKATMPDVTSFGGLFATKRNMADSAALAYSFDSFSVSETDSEAPAAPTGLTATRAPGQVELAWDASDVSSDVAGYRVYRGASAPVATTGDGIGGSALLTTPKLTDAGVFIGSSYHYAVVAVDAAGNVSAPAEIDATVPTVDGEEIAKVNFQTAAAPVPAGYTADTGLPYDAARGAGWTNATSGAPLDVSQLTRLRSGAGVTTDPRLATIAHMQHTSMTAAGVWRYDVPNGTYTVVVGRRRHRRRRRRGVRQHPRDPGRGHADHRPLRAVLRPRVRRGRRHGGGHRRVAHHRPGGRQQHQDRLRRDLRPGRRDAGGARRPHRADRHGRRRRRRPRLDRLRGRNRVRRLPRHRADRPDRRRAAQRRADHRHRVRRPERRAGPDLLLRGGRPRRGRRIRALHRRQGRRGRRVGAAGRPRGPHRRRHGRRGPARPGRPSRAPPVTPSTDRPPRRWTPRASR